MTTEKSYEESNEYHYERRQEVARELEALQQVLEGISKWTTAFQRRNVDYKINRVDHDTFC